jgi:sugar (pentulose or hexulose) kinase
MAFGDVSANYLEWFREQLPGRPGFEELAASAEPIEPGAEGLTLRTEVGLTTPEAVFAGLTSRHTSGHMVRSIMEAVAAALGNQVASLCGDSRPSEIRCAGGAARSDLWLQIKADMLGVATAAMQCDEPTSLGAAVLAEAALRAADVADVARQWVRLKTMHQPDTSCSSPLSHWERGGG